MVKYDAWNYSYFATILGLRLSNIKKRGQNFSTPICHGLIKFVIKNDHISFKKILVALVLFIGPLMLLLVMFSLAFNGYSLGHACIYAMSSPQWVPDPPQTDYQPLGGQGGEWIPFLTFLFMQRWGTTLGFESMHS